VANLIFESYRNSTVNNILDDIAKKYKIDTSKERLREMSMFKKSNSNIERTVNVQEFYTKT
jgi:Flp pilus assembly CpaE family ATPase